MRYVITLKLFMRLSDLMKLSIILPTYNESGNITLLITSLKKNLKAFDKEIIVIDDNSEDNTGKIVKNLSKKDKEIKCIIRKDEKGLASAIKRGINESTGDILVFMDTDLSHNPAFIPTMLSYINKYDMVFASRYVKGGKMITDNKLQLLFSNLFNRMIKLVLGSPILDTTNGFFVAKKSKILKLDLNEVFDDYGDYCFKLIYYLKKEAKMKEIPFTYEKRLYGKSKTSVIRHGLSYTYKMLKLRFTR